VKRIAVAAIFMICLTVTARAEPPVNGYLYTVGGQRVLHVWGTPAEMGYAHGFHLGAEIRQLFRDYVLSLLPPALYEAAHAAIPIFYTWPDDFKQEAAAMLAGLAAGGADPFIPELGRNLDVDDLLVGNALSDVGGMACSTQMAWDTATSVEPRLRGETALVRNLDWALDGPNRYLLPDMTIVLVFSPSAAGSHTVAMVSFPGFVGCLSCMNDRGVAVVLHVASNGTPLWSNDFTPGFVPLGVTLRQALQAPDADGEMNIDTLVTAVADVPRGGGAVLNLIEPRGVTTGDPAVVLEVDNRGWVLRQPADEAGWYSDVLVAANTLLKLEPGQRTGRYALMKQEITELGGEVTLGEMWAIAATVKQVTTLSTTAQTMYFLPATLEMGVAFTNADGYSCDKQPVALTWDDLTAPPPGLGDDDNDDDSVGDDDSPSPAPHSAVQSSGGGQGCG
jgi:hypothetical protein